MEALETHLHHYQINTTTPEGKAAYEQLCETIKANGVGGRGKKMRALPGQNRGPYIPHGTIEAVQVDPAIIFENQWNETAETGNRRLFDWYEVATFDSNGRETFNVRAGHWLEITPAMVEARQLTYRCGFFAQQYGPNHKPAPANGFCSACLDNIHLEEKDIYLLRLLPMSGGGERKELTADELAELLPLYVERQTTGEDSRKVQLMQKQRQDVIAEHAKQIANADQCRAALLWVLDHGMTTDNVIFYSHTGRTCIGWRKPIGPAMLAKLRPMLDTFPGLYTIEVEGGEKIENETPGPTAKPAERPAMVYHAPSHAHPGICPGCTADSAKHGQPIDATNDKERKHLKATNQLIADGAVYRGDGWYQDGVFLAGEAVQALAILRGNG